MKYEANRLSVLSTANLASGIAFLTLYLCESLNFTPPRDAIWNLLAFLPEDYERSMVACVLSLGIVASIFFCGIRFTSMSEKLRPSFFSHALILIPIFTLISIVTIYFFVATPSEEFLHTYEALFYRRQFIFTLAAIMEGSGLLLLLIRSCFNIEFTWRVARLVGNPKA